MLLLQWMVRGMYGVAVGLEFRGMHGVVAVGLEVLGIYVVVVEVAAVEVVLGTTAVVPRVHAHVHLLHVRRIPPVLKPPLGMIHLLQEFCCLIQVSSHLLNDILHPTVQVVRNSVYFRGNLQAEVVGIPW